MEILEREYREFAIGIGVRADPRIADDPEDFWCRLLDHLLVHTGHGKLTCFRGHCGLRNWLGTVARRFATTQAAAGTRP